MIIFYVENRVKPLPFTSVRKTKICSTQMWHYFDAFKLIYTHIYIYAVSHNLITLEPPILLTDKIKQKRRNILITFEQIMNNRIARLVVINHIVFYLRYNRYIVINTIGSRKNSILKTHICNINKKKILIFFIAVIIIYRKKQLTIQKKTEK